MSCLRRVPVTVNTIYRDDVEVSVAKGGENLKLRLGGIEDGEIQQGFVICTKSNPVPCVKRFKAQLQVHCPPQTPAACQQSPPACSANPSKHSTCVCVLVQHRLLLSEAHHSAC